MRTVADDDDTTFCHFYDASGYDPTFERSNRTLNFVEFYNMTAEPWQLRNLASSLDAGTTARYVAQLHKLMACSGAQSCADAERH
jgi:hypothetical protein